MGKKKFSSDLSVDGIEKLKKQLMDYKQGLNNKCKSFIQRLADEGIVVAKQNVGNFGKYITFSTTITSENNGYHGIMLATNTGIITSQWLTKEGEKSADVSPLLMIEFGSGLRAQNPKNIPGVGTGTFPGQTHASDPNGWWYMDLEGNWNHSYGITPQMPMYKASIEMHKKITSIAIEVFGN